MKFALFRNSVETEALFMKVVYSHGNPSTSLTKCGNEEVQFDTFMFSKYFSVISEVFEQANSRERQENSNFYWMKRSTCRNSGSWE